jgi:hypothetical protein
MIRHALYTAMGWAIDGLILAAYCCMAVALALVKLRHRKLCPQPQPGRRRLVPLAAIPPSAEVLAQADMTAHGCGLGEDFPYIVRDPGKLQQGENDAR